MRGSGRVVEGRSLLTGEAQGDLLALDEPLSLWGGVDLDSGRIIDAHHPQQGEVISDRILAMRSGRGSSSGSSVLAEMIRRSVAPSGVILGALDEILLVGAMVGELMYGTKIPILLLSDADFTQLQTGQRIEISGDRLLIEPSPNRGGGR